VAGNGTVGYAGDNGVATSASIEAMGVSVSKYGLVYLSTAGYGAVRELMMKLNLKGLMEESPK